MACIYKFEGKEYSDEEFNKLVDERFLNQSKTRVLYELQSDLFQKGRDRKSLSNKTYNQYRAETFNGYRDPEDINEQSFKIGNKIYSEVDGNYFINNGEVVYGKSITKEEFEKALSESEVDTKENKFLQLLNRDNAWVTFFVKSIIQDSAKKGYEKVLFPQGDTASKVEGHETLEDFKRQKEDRIKKLEQELEAIQPEYEYDNEGNILGEYTEDSRRMLDSEINQLKEEVKRVETEGFAALKPIYNFYENTVYNILKKQGYNPKNIKDEYGNGWYEVEIKPEFLNTILLSKSGSQIDNLDYELEKQNLFDEQKELKSSDLLKKLANKDSVGGQLAIKLLENLNNDVNIKLLSKEEADEYLKANNSYNTIGLELSEGFYSPNTNEIVIIDKPQDLGKTIIHEILHAISYKYLRGNSELAKEWDRFYKHTMSFMTEEELKKYQFSNKDEFFAGLSSPNFTKFLATKPSLNKGYTSLWEDIKAFLVKVLNKIGINAESSLLEDYLNLTAAIIEDTNIPIKKGIDEIFETYPELAEIGSKQQYSSYLDSIFPDSILSGIYTNNADVKIEKFDKKYIGGTDGGERGLGFYFKPIEHKSSFYAEAYGHITNYALLNVKDNIEGTTDNMGLTYGASIEQIRKNFNNSLIDGVFSKAFMGDEIFEQVVFEPEQIHILGSQEDIEGFKNWVQRDDFTVLNSVEIEELNDEIEVLTEELQEKASKDVIVKAVDEFFEVAKSRLKTLIVNRNYKRLKELLTPETGLNKLESIKDILEQAKKAADDIPGMYRKTRGLALSIIQTASTVELIQKDVKDIVENKEKALENITTLQYYLYTLNDYKLALSDLREDLEGNKASIAKIDSIIGNIEAIDRDIIKNDVSGLVDAFKPLLIPASEEYIKPLQEEINRLKKLISNTKSAENKANYEKTVKTYEEKIKNYNFSIDENVASFLRGERGDINVASAFLEAYSDNPDPIVSSFTVFVKNQIRDVNADVAPIEREYLNELAPIYKKLGNRFDPEVLGKQITFEDERLDWDGNIYKVITLLNPFKNYQKDQQVFLNEIDELKNAIKNGENIEENTNKLVEKKKEFSKWKMDYMHQEFTPEFYKKYDLWNDEIGQLLKADVDAIFDEIRKIQEPLLVFGTELSQSEYDAIDAYMRQYKLLGSVKKLNGDTKEGIELEKALRMQEIRKINQELYEWVDNTAAFEKAKLRHSEYIISTGIAPETSEYQREMQHWELENTRMVISEEFYKERDRITKLLNYYLSKLENYNENFEELWKEIKDQTYAFRDEDNQPIGSEMEASKVEQIKLAQEKIEEIKKEFDTISGLSSIEQDRLSVLFAKAKDKTITLVEREELEDIIQKSKATGLSETDKTAVFALFEELKQLQSRIPTEYYVEEFNNLSSKYGATIDDAGDILENNALIPVLESEKLNQLLENQDFKDWFTKNHIQVLKFNPNTKQKELKWERLYIWNRIIPNNPDYIQIKPSLKYSIRKVKDKYKTPQVIGETVDNKGNFLPKTNGADDRYINKEYFRLKKDNPELFKLLEVHTKFLLKAQEDIADRNKLYLDVPRRRKESFEVNIRALKELKEQPSNIPNTVWKGIKSKIDSTIDFNEDEGNYQSVFTDKYGNPFSTVPIKYVNRMDAENVSLDLFKSISKYTYSSALNKKLVEISPISNALKRVTAEFQPRDVSKISKSTKLSPLSTLNFRKDAIDRIVKRVFEGQERKMELGKTAEKGISFAKRLTVLASIMTNIPASVANVINAEFQNFINAANGYFSHRDLGKAHSVFFSEYMPAYMKDYWDNEIGKKSLQSQISDMWGFVQSHTFEETIGTKVSQSKVRDALALSWVNNHREWGELFVQSVNSLAFLSATKVQQGDKSISLLDAYELDENGVIKLKEGISPEWDFKGSKFKQLKERMDYHNIRVHGNYSKGIDKPEADTYTTYSILIMMKRFFISMFLNRFAASSINTKLQSKPRFNLRYGAEQGYYIKTIDLISKQLENKLVAGEFYAMSSSEKQAFAKTFLELGTIMLAFGLLRLAFGFDPDDKDKYKKISKKSWWELQALYQTARLLTETSTFVNIYQYKSFIMDAPFISQTLTNWFDLIRYTISQEEYTKDSGIYKKGDSKAKAKLYKVTGFEKIIKSTGEEDEMVKDYLKMRAR